MSATTLSPGQIWEFVNLVCGTVTQYELERVFKSRLSLETASLRNLEIGGGGQATVTAHWLRQGSSAKGNHWRLAES